jgi:hypothetical protein
MIEGTYKYWCRVRLIWVDELLNLQLKISRHLDRPDIA